MIYLRVLTKPQPNDAKSPLPVDVRRSKTLLLKLPYILEYGYVSTKVYLPLIARKRTVMPHYKNSGLMSMLQVHKFFKRMIFFPNFVTIARLVVRARKDPGDKKSVFQSPWSSHLDLHFVFTADFFFRKVEYKEGKFHRHRTCPTSLLSASRKVPDVNWIFTVSICYCYSSCYCSFLNKYCKVSFEH